MSRTDLDLDVLRRVADAMEALRLTATLLQQNSEGCAQNHYGEDFGLHGKPAWLARTAADIHRGASALTDLRALISRLDEPQDREAGVTGTYVIVEGAPAPAVDAPIHGIMGTKILPGPGVYTAPAPQAVDAETAGLVERLRWTLVRMANEASLPMALWGEHSNACLEAADTIVALSAQRTAAEAARDEAEERRAHDLARQSTVIAFLRKRRGQLVIERDEARAARDEAVRTLAKLHDAISPGANTAELRQQISVTMAKIAALRANTGGQSDADR